MIDDAVRKLLDDSGLPWTTERGGRHIKLRIAGHLTAILPYGKNGRRCGRNCRAQKNSLAQIQRKLRELKNGGTQ